MTKYSLQRVNEDKNYKAINANQFWIMHVKKQTQHFFKEELR